MKIIKLMVVMVVLFISCNTDMNKTKNYKISIEPDIENLMSPETTSSSGSSSGSSSDTNICTGNGPFFLNSKVSYIKDFESEWGQPKECGNVPIDQMVPGECKYLPQPIDPSGGRCTAQGKRTYCDNIMVVGDKGAEMRHTLCTKNDSTCNYSDIILSCRNMTTKDLIARWGWYETNAFSSIKEMREVTEKYNVGVWYLDAGFHLPSYGYKELRNTGAMIIPIATNPDTGKAECNLTSNITNLINNKYVDGLIINIEGDTPECKNETNIKTMADAIHAAGKLFLVTNNPGELSSDQQKLGLANIYNRYVDYLLPYMYYDKKEYMKSSYINQQKLFYGPMGILGQIGFTGYSKMTPAEASTLPGYVNNEIFRPLIGNVGHYSIFAGRNFYRCAQNSNLCSSNDIDQPISAAYSGNYSKLLDNLNYNYGSRRQEDCSREPAPKCSASNWSSTILLDECSKNPKGRKVISWKRLIECSQGVDHPFEEIVSCNCNPNANPNPISNPNPSPNDLFDFGGMFGLGYGNGQLIYYNNPATNKQSCPARYTSYAMLGTNSVDFPMYICLKTSTPEGGLYDFGGVFGGWSYDFNYFYNNPLIGSASCSNGFIEEQVLGTSGLDWPLYYCYRKHISGSSYKSRFGGIFGYGGTSNYNNPATKNTSCPSGYNEYQVYGTYGVDYPMYMCFK